jgi:Flp pilus assembly protein TadG
VLVPAIVAIICVVIAAGRIALAGQGVDAAARSAAREASLARTPGDAVARAEAAARRTLDQEGISCASLGITVDTSGLRAPVGQVGTVRADITCTVGLSDVALPGLPGSKTMRASYTSVVDRYRERG